MNQTTKPLSGVTVMDLSIYVAGPACSSLLGYLGADVIKVESIKGDPYRVSGKGYDVPAEAKKNPIFDQCNGFKRGIALDFRSDEGREALKRLAAKADIIVTNYREKALVGMGMSYEQVKEINPGVVYGVFSGYGDKGPDAERPGFDSTTFFSRSGFCMRGTYKGYAPVAPISAAGDTISSTSLAVGILAAYTNRLKTGKGEKVSSSLYGSAVWVMGIPIVQAQFGYVGPFPREEPGFIALSNDYECKDGVWVRICGMSAERYWKPLCEALGMEEYIEDPRFATSAEQHKNLAEACELVQKYFRNWDSKEITARMLAVDLPIERNCSVSEIPEDEQALVNHFVNEFAYEDETRAFLCMPPFKMDSVDDSARGRGPYLGEQTSEILRECGFEDAQIEEMLASKKAVEIR